MEVVDKEEAAKAYFFAWLTIEKFLKNKKIEFDRDTSLNSLIDQMLMISQS